VLFKNGNTPLQGVRYLPKKKEKRKEKAKEKKRKKRKRFN